MLNSEIDVKCGFHTKKKACNYDDYKCYEDELCPARARKCINYLQELLQQAKQDVEKAKKYNYDAGQQLIRMSQELQQLKAENERLIELLSDKPIETVDIDSSFEIIKLRQCLDEIEEIARTLGNQNDVKHRLDDSGIQDLFKIDDDLLSSEEILRKHILQLIEKAKEGGE